MTGYATWKGWDAADFGRCPPAAGRYFDWHLQRAFEGRIPPKLNVLEIGFGNGRFLGYCRGEGFRVAGLEANGELVSRARDAGFTAATATESLAPLADIDLIAAFDVLEHMDRQQLEEFFAQVPRWLSRRGRLIVRVPNGDSPFGGRHQNGDLSHVTAFGEFKLQQLAHASGLAMQCVGEAPWYVNEFEGFNLKMMVRGVTRTVLDYVLSMAYYNSRVDLGPNLVAVLRLA